jgi:hypothetical protein
VGIVITDGSYEAQDAHLSACLTFPAAKKESQVAIEPCLLPETHFGNQLAGFCTYQVWVVRTVSSLIGGE